MTDRPHLTAARAIARLEPLWVAIAAPLLLFPGSYIAFALILILLAPLARLLITGRLTRYSPLNFPVLAILLMALIGYLVSADPQLSWPKLWGIILQTAIFFAALNYIDTKRRLLWAAVLLLLLAPAVALLSLLGIDWSLVRLLPLNALYQDIPRLEPLALLPDYGLPTSRPLFHPREVGATIAFLLPLPLAMLLFGRGRRLRLLAAAATLPPLLLLLLTQAPMGFLGLAAALALFAVCWRWWTVIPMTLVGAGLAAAVLAYRPRELATSMLDVEHLLGIGIVLRLDMWSRALAMIGDAPLTGIGLNTYPLILSHFYPGLLLGPEPHAHNLLLQTAVDLGLPGLVALAWLFVAFFFLIACAYRRTLPSWQRALLLGLAGGALAYVAGGVLDVVTLGAKPIAALWLMLGAGAAAAVVLREEGGIPTSSPPQRKVPRWAPLSAGALAILVVAAMPGLLAANTGVVRAHHAIIAARQTGRLPTAEAESARDALQQALVRRPHDPGLQALLGSLNAWQGNQPVALNHLQRRVTLDGPRALGQYAPFVAWQRTLQNTPAPPPWDGTIRLYRAWTSRYPDRAEEAILLAIVLHGQGRSTAVKNVIEVAMERGAQPASLLRYFQLQTTIGRTPQ